MSANEKRPALEEDVIATGRVVAALVATIVLTVVCLGWVTLVMKPLQGGAPAPGSRKGSGPPAVDRTLYEDQGAGYAAEHAARKRADLESWGWIDRQKQTVRMPIGQAMRLVVLLEGAQP